MTRARTDGPTVAVLNRSSAVTDAQVSRLVDALQVQVDRDLRPAWDQPANLVFIPAGHPAPPRVWQLWLEDRSPEPDAAGFHELTSEGFPIAYAYVKDAIEGGMSWTVTVSHELLEQLTDPRIDQVRFVPAGETGGVIYALEIADAVEDDQFGYDISLPDGQPPVKVSAFVTRQWFQPGPHPVGTTYSHPPGIVHAAFELTSGGYIGVWEFGKGWSQRLARGVMGKRAVKKWTSRTLQRFGTPDKRQFTRS